MTFKGIKINKKKLHNELRVETNVNIALKFMSPFEKKISFGIIDFKF